MGQSDLSRPYLNGQNGSRIWPRSFSSSTSVRQLRIYAHITCSMSGRSVARQYKMLQPVGTARLDEHDTCTHAQSWEVARFVHRWCGRAGLGCCVMWGVLDHARAHETAGISMIMMCDTHAAPRPTPAAAEVVRRAIERSTQDPGQTELYMSCNQCTKRQQPSLCAGQAVYLYVPTLTAWQRLRQRSRKPRPRRRGAAQRWALNRNHPWASLKGMGRREGVFIKA